MPGLDDYALKYDEQGRPYYQQPGRPRNYVSPVAMGTGSRPKDETGMFHSAPQWNAKKGEWETPFDWGNAVTAGTVGLMTAGAGSALMGGGAAAAGAGGGASAAGGSAAAAGGMGAAEGVAAGGGAMSWLGRGRQYGLPVVGGIVQSVMQNNASNRANDAQMDYYDRALDWEKEQDAYRRKTDEEQTTYDRAEADRRRAWDEEQRTYGRGQDDRRWVWDENQRTYVREQDQRVWTRDQQRYDTNTRNYADFRGLLDPYIRQGTTPSAQISSLMSGRGPSAPMAQGAPQGAQPQGGATVMLEAPNGQRKAVPQAQAQHYIAQGAKQVS